MGAEVLDWLEEWLNVDTGESNHVLRISRATRLRRRAAGRLTCGESDRVFNILWVLSEALSYFEDDCEAARRWIAHPAPALGGETPLMHCDTGIGAERVVNLLRRLEHGIPA